jgi:hypothetical protein
MRLHRSARRVLLVFLTTVATLGMLISPAHAGEAARNCAAFYAQGNTSSPWHFTVCVKLIHDPTNHQWWTTGSVSSTTPGIRLYLDSLELDWTGFVNYMDETTRRGTGSDFVTAITVKYSCWKTEDYHGYAKGHAIWPNGVTSGFGEVGTDPYFWHGNC